LVAGLILVGCQTMAGPAVPAPGTEIVLKLGGTPAAFNYISALLAAALGREGYKVSVRDAGDIPTTRMEKMLEQGKLSALILGRTPVRDRRLLLVDVGMTGNLMNRRVLFIPKGEQAAYDAIWTLDDFRRSNKVAGLGEAWADPEVWTANDLRFRTLSGDWKRLYEMVASQARDVDYLPRGAQEIAYEWRSYPELQVERNLVLIYGDDHVLYVSPEAPELHAALLEAMPLALESGLIAELARKHFTAVFSPPINLHERRVINLTPANQALGLLD